MASISPEFQSGAITPVACLKTGWANIKDRYWLFLGLTLVSILVGGAVPIVLIGPMMCGLYLCLFARMRGEPVEFSLLFKGFDYFVPGLIAAAIQTVPVLVIVLAGDAVFFAFTFAVLPHNHGDAPPPIFFVGLVIFVLFVMLISAAIHVLFFFSYQLIVDRRLSGLDAVKTSFRAATKNLGGIIGLVLLNAGLGIIGLLCCYVGVFFVLPVSFASYAVAYRQVFPAAELPYAPVPPPPPGNWA